MLAKSRRELYLARLHPYWSHIFFASAASGEADYAAENEALALPFLGACCCTALALFTAASPVRTRFRLGVRARWTAVCALPVRRRR